MTSQKTIGRLSLYRRVLHNLGSRGTSHVFSHELAALAGVSSSQVRRDIMEIGGTGTPTRGYHVPALLHQFADVLDPPTVEPVCLVGVGNLGRAILAFFQGRRPKLEICAAFDRDPALTNRVIQGTRCYPVQELDEVCARESIHIGVVTVPSSEAQGVADALINAGVRGILNFAPTMLHVPKGVYVEHIDMTMSLEKVAFFTRTRLVTGKESRK